MPPQTAFVLLLLAMLGSGLIAGVFYAFSTFVMKALAERPPAEGMAAMQSINVVVLNPWFLGVFMGTAILCVAAVVAAWLDPDRTSLPLVAAGAALYVIGCFLVTAACNVPRNERLARVRADDPELEALWREYVRSWSNWNHVRTAASLAAAAMFGLALRSQGLGG